MRPLSSEATSGAVGQHTMHSALITLDGGGTGNSRREKVRLILEKDFTYRKE